MGIFCLLSLMRLSQYMGHDCWNWLDMNLQSRDVYFLEKLLNLRGDDGFVMNEVLVSLWYIMGLWPLVYSMLLLPTGRRSLPVLHLCSSYYCVNSVTCLCEILSSVDSVRVGVFLPHCSIRKMLSLQRESVEFTYACSLCFYFVWMRNRLAESWEIIYWYCWTSLNGLRISLCSLHASSN